MISLSPTPAASGDRDAAAPLAPFPAPPGVTLPKQGLATGQPCNGVPRGGVGGFLRKPSISLRLEVEGSLSAAPQTSLIKFPAVSKQICCRRFVRSLADRQDVIEMVQSRCAWQFPSVDLTRQLQLSHFESKFLQIRLDKLPFKIILPGWNMTGPIGSLWGERGSYCGLKQEANWFQGTFPHYKKTKNVFLFPINFGRLKT